MPDSTGGALLQAVAEHLVVSVYVAGTAVMAAVLTAVALVRSRVFTCAPEFAAVDNRLDRRLLLGAVVVMWSAAWPIALAMLAVRGVRAVRVMRRRW
jgi:hypothetical protein